MLFRIRTLEYTPLVYAGEGGVRSTPGTSLTDERHQPLEDIQDGGLVYAPNGKSFKFFVRIVKLNSFYIYNAKLCFLIVYRSGCACKESNMIRTFNEIWYN